jgi:hypothetical protein
MPLENMASFPVANDCTPESFSFDTSFELCPDSMLFLDQIFLGDIASPTQNTSHSAVQGSPRPSSPAAETTATDRDQNELPISSKPHILPFDLEPWLSTVIDPALFVASLHAYFDFASLCMPIMIEDAFWKDFHARRCSLPVLLAVACRGLPFVDIEGKTGIQNRIARKFKSCFLEAQTSITSRESVRLDDLEALALMIGYEYDDLQDSATHSRLCDMFMKHDSLVLMTLRFSKQHDLNADTSLSFARAKERQKLLFWHVYGLDAFHCLETKTVSYIPNNDIASCERFLQHEIGGYLDSILALAVIARRIVGSLCNATARARGVKPGDVRKIYDYLHYWRKHNCPSHLRRPMTDFAGGLQSITSDAGNRHILLQRAVLWLLEINCYMQVESCIGEYGLWDEMSLEAEIIMLRAQGECLQAVQDVVEVCQWIGPCPTVLAATKAKPLVDLAPSILRNICAGMCFWVCSRAMNLLCSESSELLRYSSSRERSGGGHCQQSMDRNRAGVYVKAAMTLRDTVAASSSHGDTVKILTRLDNQIHLLREKME